MKKKVICAAMAAMMIGAMAANVYASTDVTNGLTIEEGHVYAQAGENKNYDDEIMLISAGPDSQEAMLISEAPENYRIVVNGKTLDFGDKKLFAEKDAQGKTVLMVPLRAIAEELGFKVDWKDRSAYIDDGQMHTTVTIGQDEYSATTSIEGAVGATGPFSLGAAPQIVDNRTYVPLQIFEILMGNVEGMFRLDGTTVTISTESGNATQIANPFVDYKTVVEASAASGIKLALPESIPAGYSLDNISAIKNDIIQVSYLSDSDKSAGVLFRKGVGSEDISGDYNVYAQTSTEKINGADVTFKGNDGKVNVAVWTDGEYSYAIDITGAGLEKSAVAELVKGLK